MRDKLTGRNYWGTPPEFFNLLDSEFGPFEVDVCANDTNAKCLNFFSDVPSQGIAGVDDALAVNWVDYGERFFMNPPFSVDRKGVIGAWLAKARATVYDNSFATVVALVPCAPSEGWWDNIDPYASEIRILKRRVQFILPTSKKDSGCPHGSAVVIYRYKMVEAPPLIWRWDWKESLKKLIK
jgi:phage N-6-adenine-methyltransferase